MHAKKILVVDDDRNLLEVIRMRLESERYEVTTALDEEEAKRFALETSFDLAVVDLQLVRQDGIALMTELHLTNPGLPVIILTAHGSIESAVEAMRKGACTYLTKPFDARELLIQIERALENRRLASEVNRLRGLLDERRDFGQIVAKSRAMKAVLEVVSHIARAESTVYIHGESGTGKELIARAIHLASERREKPFIAVNCAALPETLLESELFGHEKGAFTGAVKSARGLFVQADEGTIFLDEIGDMPLPIQAKLLRVLQDRQFHPLGGEGPVQVDVRVIVATNKDLEEGVRQGLFREDLYYRIHVIPIAVPPLRERREDIPMLAEHFLKKHGAAMNREVRTLSPAALQRLMMHEWPGNVRELENTIEYAVAMAREDVISEDLILPSKPAGAEEAVKPFKKARDSFERSYLVRLLEITRGTVSTAANLAGKHRADFYNLLRKHGIDPGHFKRQN